MRILGLVAVGTLALAGFTGNWGQAPIDGLDPHDPRVTLKHVEAEVDRRWGIEPIQPRYLEKRLAETDGVLFDVREQEEYELGHLPGAIRVDPDMSAEAFYQAYGDRLAGRPAIFYCSVGVRSSQLAKRLAANPEPERPAAVFNLSGGVFRWVVEGRELVVGSAPGRLHPYDADWQQLLVRTLANE
jgi:rhodanese-related sulfurtransferase